MACRSIKPFIHYYWQLRDSLGGYYSSQTIGKIARRTVGNSCGIMTSCGTCGPARRSGCYDVAGEERRAYRDLANIEQQYILCSSYIGEKQGGAVRARRYFHSHSGGILTGREESYAREISRVRRALCLRARSILQFDHAPGGEEIPKKVYTHTHTLYPFSR